MHDALPSNPWLPPLITGAELAAMMRYSGVTSAFRGWLRADTAATLPEDLLKAASEVPHQALADVLEELLPSFGKPFPTLPVDLATRFHAMLKWHAARIVDLDSTMLGLTNMPARHSSGGLRCA